MSNIIATFPAGTREISVNGLHQWDHGMTLEIHATGLPALVEVHFAAPGMDEAVIRSCSVVSNVTTAVIPDECLEQASPVVAWIVDVGETSGETIRTIVLPVIARTRPAATETIPQSVSDRYTEAVAAMNAAVEAIEDGTVSAAHALEADHATEADSASEADHATSADSATSATTAGNASNVNNINLRRAFATPITGAEYIETKKLLWDGDGLTVTSDEAVDIVDYSETIAGKTFELVTTGGVVRIHAGNISSAVVVTKNSSNVLTTGRIDISQSGRKIRAQLSDYAVGISVSVILTELYEIQRSLRI